MAAESKPDPLSSGKDLKAPNVFERVKEEFDAILHNENQGHHHHHKETHGLRDDIDGNSSMDEVKAPNVFERAKEEMEAIVSAICPKKKAKDPNSHLPGEIRDSGTKDPLKHEEPEMHSEKNAKAPPNPSARAKTKSEYLGHPRETHGTSDNIDEDTPISEVRGPNVFERAKEEIEALIHTIHPKKDDSDHSPVFTHKKKKKKKKSGFLSKGDNKD